MNTETNCWCMGLLALNSKLPNRTSFKLWLHHWDLAPQMSTELTHYVSWIGISLNTLPQDWNTGFPIPWMPVFAQAPDDAVLLTTNGVLEDQYLSVTIPKQKWNSWEQRKQFYRPSCCSGPLKTPPGGSCLAVLWEGNHPATFVPGQTAFSSVLITAPIAFRLSGGFFIT